MQTFRQYIKRMVRLPPSMRIQQPALLASLRPKQKKPPAKPRTPKHIGDIPFWPPPPEYDPKEPIKFFAPLAPPLVPPVSNKRSGRQ